MSNCFVFFPQGIQQTRRKFARGQGDDQKVIKFCNNALVGPLSVPLPQHFFVTELSSMLYEQRDFCTFIQTGDEEKKILHFGVNISMKLTIRHNFVSFLVYEYKDEKLTW